METYDTSDFQLAVTLYTLEYRLLKVNKTNRQRAVSQFQYERGIHDDAKAFFGDDLTLPPRQLLINTKMVKDRLYSEV